MVSETKRNLVITGLQRSSKDFNDLRYIIPTCTPKRKVGGSNPLRDGSAAGDFAIKAGSGGIFYFRLDLSNDH